LAAHIVDWVDQTIEVEFARRSQEEAASLEEQQTSYTLEGADESGILLGYADESDLSDYRMLFFPWPRIERIHLLTP
jgi:S-adenosylmethionine synthetase